MAATRAQKVAQALLDIKAVGLVPEQPIRFKSGLLSPVYIDNRKLPYFPQEWQVIITSFQELLDEQKVHFEVIAGIETAGIPHSAALGYALKKPSVFVRKAVKDHGTKKMVEGGDVQEKHVLLLEDHITTGGSSLTGAENLRQAGAIVKDCIAITSYGFAVAQEHFSAAGISLTTLTSFTEILEAAVARKLVTTSQVAIIKDWLRDSQGWEEKYAQGS